MSNPAPSTSTSTSTSAAPPPPLTSHPPPSSTSASASTPSTSNPNPPPPLVPPIPPPSTTSPPPNPNPNLPTTSTTPLTTTARTAFLAHLHDVGTSHLSAPIQTRAQLIHDNAAALRKQEAELVKSTKMLRRENERLEKVWERGRRDLDALVVGDTRGGGGVGDKGGLGMGGRGGGGGDWLQGKAEDMEREMAVLESLLGELEMEEMEEEGGSEGEYEDEYEGEEEEGGGWGEGGGQDGAGRDAGEALGKLGVQAGGEGEDGAGTGHKALGGEDGIDERIAGEEQQLKEQHVAHERIPKDRPKGEQGEQDKSNG